MRPQALISLPNRRADHERTAFVTDVVKIENTIDVHQGARTEEPHVQGRDEALTAGQDFRFVSRFSQRGQRLFDRLGANVFERRRLHAWRSSTPGRV